MDATIPIRDCETRYYISEIENEKSLGITRLCRCSADYAGDLDQ